MATSEASSSGAPKPANKLAAMKTAIHDFLHEKNAFTYVFELAEKYTKLQREYIFIGIILLLGVYLVVGYGAGLIVNLIGFVYPAYKSCKAIDSEEKDDDTQWLTYWVVYAVFGIMEYFTDMILSWIPFYFLAKCAFLTWCMLPMANNGSILIYHRLIKPFVKKHEKDFDAAFSQVGDIAKDMSKKAVSAAKEAAGNVDVNQALKYKEKLDEFTATDDQESNKKDD